LRAFQAVAQNRSSLATVARAGCPEFVQTVYVFRARNVSRAKINLDPLTAHTHHTYMLTIKLIDEMLETTMQKAAEALKSRDLAGATVLMRKAAEYEDAKKTFVDLERRLLTPQTAPAVSNGSNQAKLRELPVEVTGGMIRQNLLTLTKQIRQGRIAIGEDLTIESQPSGERFRTQLLLKGNKLRERGAIARFYRDAGVRDGDFVVLTEVAPKQWTLKKASPGQYQSRRSILQSL
jgi:hypothetical protein